MNARENQAGPPLDIHEPERGRLDQQLVRPGHAARLGLNRAARPLTIQVPAEVPALSAPSPPDHKSSMFFGRRDRD